MVDLVLRHLPIRPAETLGRLVHLGSRRRRRSSKLCKLGRAEPTRTVQDVVESLGNIGRCQRRYCDSLVVEVAETPTDLGTFFEANEEDLDIEFVLRRDFQEDECEDGNALRHIDSAQFSDITFLTQGGFGSIYTATWQRPGKTDLTVALKIFNGNDDVNDALFDELSELSRCRYFYFPYLFGVTNVSVSVPAHGREDARALVMQYYPDGDLGTLLAEESDAISWKWRLNILRHTCAALSRAHDFDILHCNLHSGNILVERLRTMVLGRVSDFGLSRVFNDKENHGVGSYGIIPYMAPELLRGERHSKATDIYALGMIMWELSAGRSPFSDCAHDIDLMLRICNGERPPIVVGTPDCWVQLMERCWDQAPHQRPTAREVFKELITWIRFRRNYNVKAIIQFEEAEEQRRQSTALLLSTGWHPQAERAGKWVPSTEMISEHYELISDDDWEEALANMT